MSLLKMSTAPHERAENTTASLMGKVLIALAPSLIWACFIFGLRALTLTLISVASCVASEYLFCVITKRPHTVNDLSAVVTGVLIAFNMPISAPLWIPVFGGAFAIVVVKCLFGGMGKNIVNPALAARVFMLMSWTDQMSKFPALEQRPSALALTVDVVSGATPLADLKNGIISSDLPIMDMFLGNMNGCIGEVSALLLIGGGIFLILSKVITWHIPTIYIGTVAIVTLLLPHAASAFDFKYMLAHIFSGGLMLGAIYMATDYATSPITKWGRVIYAVGCGLITVFIRYFGGYPEGVSFAILIMNLLVWYIDRLTKPTVFGGLAK